MWRNTLIYYHSVGLQVVAFSQDYLVADISTNVLYHTLIDETNWHYNYGMPQGGSEISDVYCFCYRLLGDSSDTGWVVSNRWICSHYVGK